MCTISWVLDKNGYRIYFNRDEQKSRPLAIPPQIFESQNARIIMPIDPQGEGSWCAVNNHGMCFALLNFYQGRLPKGRLISRGQIVKQCAQFSKISDVKEFLTSLNLAKYAPFSLACFFIENGSPILELLRWTGKELIQIEQDSPLISSAINFEEVCRTRLDVAKKLLDGSRRHDDILNLHASHLPSRSSHSICMHRDDAHTVSFSFIQVDQDEVRFQYSDGAPCSTELDEPVYLARVIPY